MCEFHAFSKSGWTSFFSHTDYLEGLPFRRGTSLNFLESRWLFLPHAWSHQWFSDVLVHEFAHVVSLKANSPLVRVPVNGNWWFVFQWNRQHRCGVSFSFWTQIPSGGRKVGPMLVERLAGGLLLVIKTSG